jgi:hypothetical protein
MKITLNGGLVMKRLRIGFLSTLLLLAGQTLPSSAAEDCLSKHADCTNACVRRGDLGDPNCAIRCRETYDQCKGGGITGSTTGSIVRDTGGSGGTVTQDPRRPVRRVTPAVKERSTVPMR